MYLFPGKYLREILNQQHILRTLIGDLTLQVASHQIRTEPTAESIFTKFNFPLKMVTELQELDNYLDNSENFQNVVSYHI